MFPNEISDDPEIGMRVLAYTVTYRQQVGDVVEERAYAPLTRAASAAGDAARRVQNGSTHRYLAFCFVALLAVIAVVSLW